MKSAGGASHNAFTARLTTRLGDVAQIVWRDHRFVASIYKVNSVNASNLFACSDASTAKDAFGHVPHEEGIRIVLRGVAF